MKWLLSYVMVYVLLTGAWKVEAAPFIFDTAADPVLTPPHSGLAISDNFWPLHRFEISFPTMLETVGGFFDYRLHAPDAEPSRTLFAAIVRLTGPSDLPDSINLTTNDLLATTLIPVSTGSIGMYQNTLLLMLEPGWYALQFGTGAFGASNTGSDPTVDIPEHRIDLDPQFFITVRQSPPGLFQQPVTGRFFATGVQIPEPSTLFLIILCGVIGIPFYHWHRWKRAA